MTTEYIDRVVNRFEEGFNCSQAVLSAYGPDLGLDAALALKIAGGFGGGMGRQGGTCGAVTGAFMALGLRYGSAEAEDEAAKEEAYAKVRELAQRFAAQHGSTLCRDLLGSDISTPEGRQLARERRLFTTLCPQLVRTAAEILEPMLFE
jgi:C_GCAxxG_C_C family probable redox protein